MSLHRPPYPAIPSSSSTYISRKWSSPSQALQRHVPLTVASSRSLQMKEGLVDGRRPSCVCRPSRDPGTLMSITILRDRRRTFSVQRAELLPSLLRLRPESWTELQPCSLREVAMTRRPVFPSEGFSVQKGNLSRKQTALHILCSSHKKMYSLWFGLVFQFFFERHVGE